MQFLYQYVADSSQYLEIILLNGNNIYLPGPSFIWFDIKEHKEIYLKQKTKIATNEAMICYKTNENGITKREILRGPMLYSPSAPSEWFHQFKWHYPEQVMENKGILYVYLRN